MMRRAFDLDSYPPLVALPVVRKYLPVSFVGPTGKNNRVLCVEMLGQCVTAIPIAINQRCLSDMICMESCVQYRQRRRCSIECTSAREYACWSTMVWTCRLRSGSAWNNAYGGWDWQARLLHHHQRLRRLHFRPVCASNNHWYESGGSGEIVTILPGSFCEMSRYVWDNYPEMIAKVLNVNVPAIFSTLFKAVKPFIPERSRDKLVCRRWWQIFCNKRAGIWWCAITASAIRHARTIADSVWRYNGRLSYLHWNASKASVAGERQWWSALLPMDCHVQEADTARVLGLSRIRWHCTWENDSGHNRQT